MSLFRMLTSSKWAENKNALCGAFLYPAAASMYPCARNQGEMAELVEGAPLLREYGVKSPIEGSNPSLSANFGVLC